MVVWNGEIYCIERGSYAVEVLRLSDWLSRFAVRCIYLGLLLIHVSVKKYQESVRYLGGILSMFGDFVRRMYAALIHFPLTDVRCGILSLRQLPTSDVSFWRVPVGHIYYLVIYGPVLCYIQHLYLRFVWGGKGTGEYFENTNKVAPNIRGRPIVFCDPNILMAIRLWWVGGNNTVTLCLSGIFLK